MKELDTSRQTQRIVLFAKERQAILDEVEGRISEEDLLKIFEYLAIREIVDINFDDII